MKYLFPFFYCIVIISNFLFAQKNIITSRILGSDNKPMAKAFVNYYDYTKQSYMPINVGEDGSFRYATNQKVIKFQFSGVNHRTVHLPVYLEKSCELKFDILLAAYSYKDNFDDVRIYGNFNKWDVNNHPKYNKADNGIYSWNIQSDLDTLEYQLWNITNDLDRHVINGTMADNYIYYPDRGVLLSLMYNRGKTVYIEFDPAKLIKNSKEAVIHSDMPDSSEIRIMNECLSRESYLQKIQKLASRDSMFRPDLNELARNIKGDLDKEKNSLVRAYHYYKYISLLRDMHLLTVVSEISVKMFDSSLYVNALEEIDPSSAFWSYNPNVIYSIKALYFSKDHKAKYNKYIDQVISKNEDPEVIAEALWVKAETIKNDIKEKRRELENPRIDRKEFMEVAAKIIKDFKEKYNLNDDQLKSRQMEYSKLIGAEYKKIAEAKKKEIRIDFPEIRTAYDDFSKQEEISRQCLERIVSDFPNTTRGKIVKNAFYSLKMDDPVPEFSVRTLDSSRVLISEKSMSGKYYLLDFWASWCSPCMANMQDLHDVHGKLKDKNFEILSISFDQSDDAVNKFRQKRYPMPWLHTRLDKGFEDEMSKRFGVAGIPKMFLISPEGKILANDWDLRGQYFVEKIVKLVNGE